MSLNTLLQFTVFLAVLIALSVPLGTFMGKVIEREPVFLDRVFRPLEHGVYRATKRHQAPAK